MSKYSREYPQRAQKHMQETLNISLAVVLSG